MARWSWRGMWVGIIYLVENKRYMNSKIKRWLIALLHGILLFGASWVWLSSSSTYGNEATLIKWASTIKRTVLQIDEDPPSKDFLFINVAHDKELIASDEFLGKEVITDRGQLAALFNIIKAGNNPQKFVLCDVYLKGDSPNDSTFSESVKGLKKAVFPIHAAENDSFEIPKFNVNYAIADYKTTGDAFLKFNLVQQKKIPSVPVFMYNKLDDGKIVSGKIINTDKGWPIFNNPVIDFPIRSYELFEGKEYPLVNLSELSVLPPEVVINDYLKNRIVLIADFDNDTHSTIYGETPGTFILLNTYLMLKKGYHIVSLWWVLLMLISYTILSYFLFFSNTKHRRVKVQPKPSFIASFLNYVYKLGFISILSYLLFNVYVNILIFAVYLNCVEYIIGLINKTNKLPKIGEFYTSIKDTYFNFK